MQGKTSDGRLRKLLYSQKAAPYLFVLPFIVSFFLFFLYPMVNTIIMAFQEIAPGVTKFIGLKNFSNLMNPDFYKALRNSTVFTLWTLLILIPVPLVLAIFLNSSRMVAKNFFRSAMFIPALTSVVVAGTIFRLIFGELEGALLNSFLGYFGVDPIKWLVNPWSSMMALVALASWRWIGVNILYFLSALQNIPNELYESAGIDGATALQKCYYITLPMLKPITIYVLTISIYGGYAMFTESYMLWGGSNSPQNIGLTIVGYIYREGLQQNNMGFGAAVGITLLCITLVINIIQLRATGQFRKED
ncbi:carbohydrate ABC transporter permease [Paenibacillus abyssi]|uniref:carbohydrate ABC transporter permease n=1 Tax=Paenibacillus abyssi TaxID=1340531 RepID=UPI0035711330